ncbi:GHKL domain-containing protein [uncultured Subdoligranulum sp.]|uniref:sensor histidine kinase n=1 Tax=uncultured Subdoligranulum sp. TaxID=512298 RepID=UPI00261CAC9F|nr:GHKL domain-containing protein [uncultured Subdoligranulum sp.]
MVEFWGNVLSLVGNIVSLGVQIVLCDSFFPRKNRGNLYWLIVAVGFLVGSVFSIFVGSGHGYTLKILFEVALYYVLCIILYQGRWDRCLFVIVTTYAVLYSASYWTNSICMLLLHLTHEEYIWNIPLYSAVLIFRALAFFALALIIRKYHPPLSVGKQARAWVPLSVVFPLSTLLIIWQIYTFPNEQEIWQICLLILDVVDVVALLLLDHLEQSAVNREKLVAAAERAHVQDENIQALSQAYAGQRKMTHDYRAQLSTLSGLLEQGNLEDAKAFLSEMKDRQSERILLINTHNAAIDAVLNQKGYAGQKKKIDMRFRVNDLSMLKLPRVDVTIVLANLLDNAMEACSQMPETERWVSVQLLYGQGLLSISIINPSRPVQIVGGQIATTKPEPLLHGYGLRNIEDILDKYHAEYTFSFKDGRFIFTADWPDIDN